MSKLLALLLLAPLLALSANADTEWITVRAVDASVDSRSAAVSIPGRTTSSTGCSALGGTLNCQTTQNTAPPQLLAVSSTKIINIVETETHRLKLYCEVGAFTDNCNRLISGDKFQAQIKGTKVLIRGRKGGNMGKQVTLKFKLLDMRPKAAEVVQVP